MTIDAMDNQTPSGVRAWRHYRMGPFLGVSCLAVAMVNFALMWTGNTLVPWEERWQITAVIGLIMSAFGLCLAVSLSSLVYAWLRRHPGRVWLGWLLMSLPFCFLVGDSLRMTLRFTLPYWQPEIFQKITGKNWPAGARLLAHRGTLFLADSKHIWFFESEPQVFEQFSQRGDWSSMTAEDLEWDHVSQRFPWGAVENIGPVKWRPAEFWDWAAGKDAPAGPFGPVYLLADLQHRRWCVWYDGY